MGASTSFTKWHPEDDLLLKNAVEAGASLESLAKGAVHFSQRFTVQELEERWCSLLYDLNTSTEASARIIEIEIGALVNNPLKSGRACNSKVKETSYNKRKGESLQCRYYTARKKARSESHKPLKLAFIISPSSHAAIDSDISASDQFKLQNEFELIKYPTHIPFTDDYGHPETIYGCNQHVYPKIVDTAAPSTLSFHGGMVDSIETSLPAGIPGTDCLYGHTENTPIPLDEARFNDASENFEPNLTQKKFSHALDRNNCPSQMLDAPESRSSFHHLGYSTSPSGPPIWKAIEDSSTPTIQMDGQFEDKSRGAVNIRCINKINDQPCDNTSKNKLIDGTSAASNNSTIPLEANFIDFSDSCMSFTDDEELLLIDVDDDDVGDRSCLNDIDTVFIGSPAAVDMDDLHIPDEIKPSEVFDVPSCNDAGSSLEQEIIHEELHTDNTDLHISVVPEVSILTSSSGSSPTAVVIEKLMICVLNTEDKDIPCNDDATFPAKLFQAFPIHPKQDISSSLAHDGKTTSADCSLVKEGKTGMLPIVSNVKAGHSVLPKVSLLQSIADCKLESASSEKDLLYQSSTTLTKDIDDPSLISSAIQSHFAPDLSLKQETTTETNLHVSCISSHPELVSSELGSVDLLPTMSISDEEQFPENEEEDEDDVPYFSDVEDLILGMDLDPYDQESCLLTKEVSRYQCMDTKKTIIRLEQSARSYVNRAISSQGAFAIFYGRRLKYFIKSPEVLLGRETEDIKVDIDLGKEGRANKISRRQAIIKMDEDGYFHLKNIGKSSIFVNSKEVPAKKRINLCLSALIEIKDMRFLFEVNERAVRRHVDSIQRVSSHQPKSEFDFPYS